MNILKTFDVRNPIITLVSLSHNQFYIGESIQTYRKINCEEFTQVHGFRLEEGEIPSFEQGSALTTQGTLLATWSQERTELHVWNVEIKEKIYTFDLRKKSVFDAVSIDPMNRFVVGSANDGQIALWSLETGALKGLYSHHFDRVTRHAFSHNGQWVAFAGWDKKISFLNLSTLQNPFFLGTTTSLPTAMIFVHSSYFFSGDKEGEILWFNLESRGIKKRFNRLSVGISSFCWIHERWLACATKDKKIYLIDLEKEEFIKSPWLSFDTHVTTMTRLTPLEYLVVGTVDGKCHIFDLKSDMKAFTLAISQKNFEDAYKIGSMNPMILASEGFLRLEAYWEKKYNEAITLFENEKIDEALQLLAPFKKISSKMAQLKKLEQEFSEYPKFISATQKNNFALAYNLANKNLLFRQTRSFKFMEDEWNKRLTEAMRLLSESRVEQANEILTPFRGVSDKTEVIQLLFEQRDIYMIFKTKLMQQDLKSVYDLVGKYPQLSSMKEFKNLETAIILTQEQAHEAFKQSDYKKAMVLSKKVMDSPLVKTQAEEILQKAGLFITFLAAMNEKKLAVVYAMARKHPFLEECYEFDTLEREWYKKLVVAERAALMGNIMAVKKGLALFYVVSEKRQEMLSVLSLGYVTQLEKYIGQAQLGLLIRRVIDLCGYDKALTKFLDRLKDEYAIDYSQELNGYTPSNVTITWESFPDTIIK